jgi:hypothetical protein
MMFAPWPWRGDSGVSKPGLVSEELTDEGGTHNANSRRSAYSLVDIVKRTSLSGKS